MSRGGYPAEGELIGPFRVGRRLGGGAMGVVHVARDDALDREVALKVIAPHLAEDDGFRRRFTREARALAALDSPHVVHVYTHGEADGRLYIATQLVPDGDLGRLLEDGDGLPVAEALGLIAQVADGLADAHAAGLVHRDIKPANVLLRRRADGLHAYLSDFGVARELDDPRTRTAGTVGTPSYMAPELHTGGRPGVASDVYSVGCLLWATLSGRAPYAGTTDYQVVSAHLEQPVPQLTGSGPLVAEVNRILRTAMAKEPADRYLGAARLRDDLRRAGTLPRDPRPSVRGGGARGHPVAVVVGAAVLLLAVGGIAYAAARGGGDDSASEAPPVQASARGVSRADLLTATASLAATLESRGTLTRAQARCTARRWLEDAGLETMRSAGFFDDGWTYVDQDRSAMTPTIAAAAASAARGCA